MSLVKYLQLLDWTGRQLRSDKAGAIPGELAPVLSRLGLESESWCRVVGRFGKLFRRVAGRRESVDQEAVRRNQYWIQAPGSPLLSGS